MKLYWTYRPYSHWRAFKAFLLGMIEFRDSFTTHFWDWDLQNSYEAGRNMAHKLTFRYFEEDYL